MSSRGRPGLLTLDPGNPPSPEDAKALLADVAKELGADPDQPDEVRKALEALIEAAGADGPDPDPTARPNGRPAAESVIDPKIVNNAAWKQLNASERAACKAHGCSAVDFLRVKRMIKQGR